MSIEEAKYNILVSSSGRLHHVPFSSYKRLIEYFVCRVDPRLKNEIQHGLSNWEQWKMNKGEDGKPLPILIAMWRYDLNLSTGEYQRRNMDVESQMEEFNDYWWCKKHDEFLSSSDHCDQCISEQMQMEDQENARMAHIEAQEVHWNEALDYQEEGEVCDD